MTEARQLERGGFLRTSVCTDQEKLAMGRELKQQRELVISCSLWYYSKECVTYVLYVKSTIYHINFSISLLAHVIRLTEILFFLVVG